MLDTVPPKAPVEIEYRAVNKLEQIAAKIAALDTRMSHAEIAEIVQFIENWKMLGDQASCYLRKEVTKLARTIEFDVERNIVLIHLKTHKINMLGKGLHKVVTLSVLYDETNPQLVANAVLDVRKQADIEIEVLKKFKGCAGLIEPIYISKHKKKSGRQVYEIITPLYNRGSLKSYLRKKRVSLAAKVKIALDTLTGACSLNDQDYVMSDNHAGNVFVHEDENSLTAVLGDIGSYTTDFATALRAKPFGPTGRSAPPDLMYDYLDGNLDEQSLLSYHVYALGRVMYECFYEHDVPWRSGYDEDFPSLRNIYKAKKNPALLAEIDRLERAIIRYTEPRLQKLFKKYQEGQVDPKEQFELIVLQMVSPFSEIRKTNAHWRNELEKLYTQLQNPKS